MHSDALIGTFEMDLLQIYFHQDHEVWRTWVPLTSLNKDEKDPGVHGYLKLSATLLAPGDKRKPHDLRAEELDELKEAVASGDRGHAQEELGDLLFTLVNVARWCGIEPEEGLAGSNRRFLDRFSRVEAALDGDLQGRSIVELEILWQQAKAQIKAEQSAPAAETP